MIRIVLSDKFIAFRPNGNNNSKKDDGPFYISLKLGEGIESENDIIKVSKEGTIYRVKVNKAVMSWMSFEFPG